MTLLLNGQLFEDSDQALISPANRGLLYGQNVFETIAVADGVALLLDEHITRLTSGAQRLQIPLDVSAITDEVNRLSNAQELAVVRAMVSMGAGGRGYQNPSAPEGVRVVSLHDYPNHPKEYYQQGIHLGLTDIQLGRQPALAGIKHGNRLEQILARNQWQDGWQEALVLDQNEDVIEATQANIFALKSGVLCTPLLDQSGVAGVMRDYVISVADKVGVDCQIVSLSVSDIETADALFVTNSVIGLWPVKRFKNRQYNDFDCAHKLLNLMIKNGAIPTL